MASRAAPVQLAVALAAALAAAGPVRAQEWQARAVRVPTPPVIDGVLDEAFWSTIEPVTGFLQRDPVDGAQASERTEVRIGYDRDALYFGMTMYDSEPDRILRNILQRGGWIDKDDRVVIALDTYRDGRNAYEFEIGALGAQDDALITDESDEDWNWDGIYHTEARVTDEGWVLEVAIPFTTIRFPDVEAPEMGIAFMRSIRRKNESVYWPHIGQEYRAGIRQVSRYATLTGIRDVRQGRHIEVKPYAIAGTTRAAADTEWDSDAQVGLDVKAAVTSNLAVDLTWNTDFAQVEADNVQINLTRFNLFFPEKREFFLERAGLFQFGAPRETEVFFSRRVGLDADIVGGGRATGQAGPLTVGALSLRTAGNETPSGTVLPAAWSSVARVEGSPLSRTTLGGIVTSKESDTGHNRVAGADFETRFWSSSSLRIWGANVWDDASAADSGSTWAGQAELILQNDRYMFEITRTRIGEAFDPALGFVPRPDQKRWGGQLQFRPRFEESTWARQLILVAAANRITGIDGDKQSHFRNLAAALNLHSGDHAAIGLNERFERLEAPDVINGRVLPAGDYTFRNVSLDVRPDRAREIGVNVGGSVGDFWSGTRRSVYGGVVWKMNRHLTIDSDVSWNDVSLPVADGDFSTTLVSTRLEAAATRRLFAYALLQWDDVSDTFQTNVRVDWIHTPGSDLFVVFDTGYLTGRRRSEPGMPTGSRWTRRTGVVKLTYLKAF